jgi:DNA mismatch repair protein MutS
MNSPTTFDSLERFISIYCPCEAILIGNLSEKEFDDIINYVNIQCKTIHRISTLDQKSLKSVNALNYEKQNYQKVILEKFFDIQDFSVFYSYFYENPTACQAYCYLLDFVYQHNPNLVSKLQEPVYDNKCSDRLNLANHSLKQLNIIDDPSYTGRYSSVEKLLNLCVTPMGKRGFANSLLNPTTNIVWLQEEYDITGELFQENIDDVRRHLSTIKDLAKINRQIIMKKMSPRQLYVFYNNLKTCSTEIYPNLPKSLSLGPYLLKRIGSQIGVNNCFTKLIAFLEKNVNIELCGEFDMTQFSQFDTNFICSGVDLVLDERSKEQHILTKRLDSIRLHLNSAILNTEKAKSKSKKGADEYVKIHETEKNNLSLIATKKRCSVLKELFKGDGEFTELTTEFGDLFKINLHGTLTFTTQTSSNDTIGSHDINELCKKITNLKIQMKDLITSAYYKILLKMSEFQREISLIVDFITYLDVILTKTTIAKRFNYCKPIIMKQDASFLKATAMRHCLIEHIQQSEIYVSNDLSLGSDGILLFGTNAVGKTSLIRATGICVIMAQSGIFVTCGSFTYSPYNAIFTRILGNDNIFKGLSTFAVEMSELRTILRLADKNSLVLGDELCSGTESISATSIFVSGIQSLAARETSFIFATHLHEITGYSEIIELSGKVHMKHMAIAYDREKDKLIYDRRIREGAGDNMYGLEVCKALHLPSDFLENAYQIRAKYHPTSGGSILGLKTSHYNSKKVVGLCEICKKMMGTEVHHIEFQRNANKDGIISIGDTPFHKNHLANLLTLCEYCHKNIHK